MKKEKDLVEEKEDKKPTTKKRAKKEEVVEEVKEVKETKKSTKKVKKEEKVEEVAVEVEEKPKKATRKTKKEEAIKKAESQSNVDNMVQATVEEETKAIQEMSDKKILKLASLALLLKSLPQEKQNAILSKFNEPEARVLKDYLNMENLEAKVDPKITQRCLGEVKSILPQPKHSSSENCMFKLKKLIFRNGREQIDNLVKFA